VYMLILLVMLMAMLNLTLIVWIIRVQNFGMNGPGQLYITTDGILVDSVSEFMNTLRIKRIHNSKPLQLTSRHNITLSAYNNNNDIVSQISLGTNEIILKNQQLHIEDHRGRVLLHADDNSVSLNIPHIKIQVPGGVKVGKHIKVSKVHNDNDNLTLQSRRGKIKAKAKKNIQLGSKGADLDFQTLNDVTLKAKNGKVLLDSHIIRMLNSRKSTIHEDNLPYIHQGVREVCVCPDGTLFLAPTQKMHQCKVDAHVCG